MTFLIKVLSVYETVTARPGDFCLLDQQAWDYVKIPKETELTVITYTLSLKTKFSENK